MSVVLPDFLASLPLIIPKLAHLAPSGAVAKSNLSHRLDHLFAEPRLDDAGWHVSVAESLWHRGEWKEALGHAEKGVLCAKANDDGKSLRDALLLLTEILIHAGRMVEAEEAVAQLDGVTYGIREPHAQARFSEAKGWLLLRTGDLSNRTFFEAESRFRSALRVAGSLGDVPAQLRCMDGLASSLAATGQYLPGIEQLDEALELAVKEGAWAFLPSLLQDRSFALRDLGFHPAADVHFSETLAWAEAVGDVLVTMRSLMGFAVLKSYSVSIATPDGLPEVESMLERARGLAIRSSSFPIAVEIGTWYSRIYEKLGRLDQAEEALRMAREFVPEGDDEEGMRILVTRNIERRAMEQAREGRFRSRTRETIESIPDALFILDPVRSNDGQVADLLNEFRNSAADRLAGCQSTDVRTLAQLRELDVFFNLEEPIFRAIQEREPYSDEIELPIGSDTWISRRIVPVGEGIALTVRDVSSEHAADRALRDAAAKAHQADRAKSEFLANMSHEIRTPINGVLGLARLLSETRLDGIQRKYVEGISASADILLAVLGDVLDLSKIEAGRIELHPEATGVRRLAGDVVALFQGQASQRGISLEVKVDEEVPGWVSVDGPRLRQVLANLVGNAVKFTAEGSVLLHVKVVPSGLRFDVADTGPGVPPDEFATIFQAFRQGHTGSTLGGTGLGLTISRRIVEIMGGTIGLSSHPGQGSCFWVELPLAEVPAPVTFVADSPSIVGARVLLVEDNPVNVVVATGLLEIVGCEVDVADDGSEAVRMARGGRYAIILMDVRMPGMDGIEATRRIRAEEANGQRVPIVALTASALTDDREECYAAGMDDYLGKPVTAEALYATLSKWIRT